MANVPEPIAIVGIGCRFPGDANNPESFWKLLCSKTDAIRNIPKNRWNIDDFYDSKPFTPGMMNVRQAGFIEGMDLFDSTFFGMSPREVRQTDPQQRLLLEVTWEALENAGINPQELARSRTGVFIGAMAFEFFAMQLSELQRYAINVHTATGISATLLSNRLSYWFNLCGPSLTLDTACSSSLVALHLACQSIWSGESDYGIVGGVNAILKPEYTVLLSQAGLLSPDCRCKAFDERADGYVRGEGAAVVFLKPLAKALENNDRIYAIIRGTGSNQDGNTEEGITFPSQESQTNLNFDVYKKFNISPGKVQYVEAHGTGTAAGDFVEASSIGTVFSTDRAKDDTCIIGSVKTNIGHLESCAGMAGLIKACLSLYNGQIPPNLHFETPNPRIAFDKLKLRVLTEVENFPGQPEERFVGVNGFGFGGTNAHAILQSSKATENQTITKVEHKTPIILPISARSDNALRELVQSYLDIAPNYSLYDLCHNASLRRSHHNYRAAFVASSTEELISLLQDFLANKNSPQIFSGKTNSSTKLAFTFSGMGTDWPGMAAELICEPIFRDKIQECDNILKNYVDWSVMEVFLSSDRTAWFEDIKVRHLLLFCFQVGLTSLWEFYGIHPEALVGYSAGEVTSAYISKAINLDEAIQITYQRTLLHDHAKSDTENLLFASISPQEAEQMISEHEDVSIAIYYSPQSVVLSGNDIKLKDIAQKLQERPTYYKAVPLNVCYHNPLLDLDAFYKSLNINAKEACFPLFSTVTPPMATGESLTAEHWKKHLQNPVQFNQTIDHMFAEGYNTFLEISPKPDTIYAIRECLEDKGHCLTFGSTNRKEPERMALFKTLASLYITGLNPNWQNIYPQKTHFVELPSYPWQKNSYWEKSEEVERYRSGGLSNQVSMGSKTHSLLGNKIDMPIPVWKNDIDSNALPYLKDHQVQGDVIYPAAAYVEMALAAISETFTKNSAQSILLQNIDLLSAFVLEEKSTSNLQFVLNSSSFAIFSSRDSKSWMQHVQGDIAFCEKDTSQKHDFLTPIKERCSKKISTSDCYQYFYDLGIEQGPHFRIMTEILSGNQESLATIEVTQRDGNNYCIYPTVLDACFQVLIGAVGLDENNSRLCLPTKINSFCFHRDVPQTDIFFGHAQLTEKTSAHIVGDLQLLNREGIPIVEITGLECRYLEQEKNFLANLLYEDSWKKVAHSDKEISSSSDTWLVFCDKNGMGNAVSEKLKAHGKNTICVRSGTKFQFIDSENIEICCDDHESFKILFNHQKIKEAKIKGILYFWNFDLPKITVNNYIQNQECISLLYLVKAVAGLDSFSSSSLWLFSKENHGLSNELISPNQSPLWGLGRVIANEFPDLPCKMVDCNPNDIDLIVKEIGLNEHENEVAFYNNERYVKRLAKIDSGKLHQEDTPISTDGTVLITGGLKGAGLATAKWLAESGVKSLALVGRSGANTEEAKETIRSLQELQVSVEVIKADISDSEQVAQMLNVIKTSMLPLKGIVHSANVYDDASILTMSRESFERVMNAKALGAWNLHCQTLHENLDFFVLFSSISATVGNPGQGNYVAANYFLDSLAHYRCGQGLKALSINWGALAETGYLARNAEVEKHIENIGMKSLRLDQVFAIMKLLMQSNITNITAASIDWNKWAKLHPCGSSGRFSELVSTEDVSDKPKNLPIIEKLKKLPSDEHSSFIETEVKTTVADILGYDQASEIDSKVGFFEMGMSSVLAMELRSRLQTHFGCKLSSTFIFKYPTIKDMAEYLCENILQSPIEVQTSTDRTPSQQVEQKQNTTAQNSSDENTFDKFEDLFSQIQMLSEQEAEKMLLEEIEQIDLENFS